MDRVHETDLLALVAHDQGVRAGAAAEESDAVEKVALGHAGRGEHEVLAWGQIVGRVDALFVGRCAHSLGP
jgi:hypothetical protein